MRCGKKLGFTQVLTALAHCPRYKDSSSMVDLIAEASKQSVWAAALHQLAVCENGCCQDEDPGFLEERDSRWKWVKKGKLDMDKIRCKLHQFAHCKGSISQVEPNQLRGWSCLRRASSETSIETCVVRHSRKNTKSSTTTSNALQDCSACFDQIYERRFVR